MSNRLTCFLESNNLLCEQQFGFRKSHSTLHPLVHFLNKISEAKNQNKHTIAIFCDLRKAFDTVDHQILLKQLSNLGVRGIELEWFRNYLSNRKQFVSINEKTSSLLSVFHRDQYQVPFCSSFILMICHNVTLLLTLCSLMTLCYWNLMWTSLYLLKKSIPNFTKLLTTSNTTSLLYIKIKLSSLFSLKTKPSPLQKSF